MTKTKGQKARLKAERAGNSFVREARGGATVRSISVTTVAVSKAIPDRVSKFYCENTGGNPGGFNFGSDSAFWQLAVGEKMPFPIEINGQTILNVKSTGGPTTFRCIFSG